MRFIQRADRAGLFELVAAQSPDLLQRFPALMRDDLATGLRLIDADHAVFRGADAVYQIARRLPGWRLLAWVYRVPGLRQGLRAAYGWVAARRYRLAGRCDETCAPDQPERPPGHGAPPIVPPSRGR